MLHRKKEPIKCDGIVASFGLESVSIYIPTFDLIKELMWKKDIDVYKVRRIHNKDDRMEVKLLHHHQTAKKDVYWVMKVRMLISRNLRGWRCG